MIIEKLHQPCAFDDESCVGQVVKVPESETMPSGFWLCDLHRHRIIGTSMFWDGREFLIAGTGTLGDAQ